MMSLYLLVMNLHENISRVKELMSIISEDNEYYDNILDLYSEVGMEGLSQDEQEYLKSGGQTELPKRFKSKISQQKYDDFVSNNKNVNIKTSDWQDIFGLQEIIDNSPTLVFVVNNFDNIGFHLDILCSLVFPLDMDIIKNLKSLNHYSSELSEIKDNEFHYVIPKYYLEHLNGLKIRK